jgi:hypothetical protein
MVFNIFLICATLSIQSLSRVLETLPQQYGLSRPQIFSLTTSSHVNIAHMTPVTQIIPHTVISACDFLQTACYTSIHGNHVLATLNHMSLQARNESDSYQLSQMSTGLENVERILNTFAKIAQIVLNDRASLSALADLCLQVNPEIKVTICVCFLFCITINIYFSIMHGMYFSY